MPIVPVGPVALIRNFGWGEASTAREDFAPASGKS